MADQSKVLETTASQPSAEVALQCCPRQLLVQLPQGSASSQPVSREECPAMIREVLQTKVGPALQAAFSQVGAELVSHAVKIITHEHDVRMLKIRAAWTEKDLMYSQIEAAKKTLVVRNFPEWATAADRELTLAEAVKEHNLGYLEWDLTTTTMEGTGGKNKKFLAPISILTVQTYDEEKPAETDETKETQQKAETTQQETATPGVGDANLELEPPDQDDPMASPNSSVVLVHPCMPCFKKETLTPRWKTLILEDKEGAWLGRILYSRKAHSLTGTAGTVADWACEVQLPAEHNDRILTAWRDVWYDQLKQQISQTEVEKEAYSTAAQKTSQEYAAASRLNRLKTNAVPSDNEGEEWGSKTGTTRTASTFRDLRQVKEPHGGDGGRPGHGDRGGERDQISLGYDISKYSTEQTDWVKGKKLRHIGAAAASAVLTGRPRPRLSA
ncbi:unnamed protein product [Symbiodinium sp. CCMP2592]|nr:unnamed protein product [Symbiodinium sp. CCMP2592]